MEMPTIHERLIDTGPKIICLPDNAFGTSFLRQLPDSMKSNLKAVVVNSVNGHDADTVNPEFRTWLSARISPDVPLAISPMTSLTGNGTISTEPRRTISLLSEMLHHSDEAVTILAFSNMTDLAVLLMTEPLLKSRIVRIIIPESNAADYRSQGFACGGILDPDATFFLLKSEVPVLFLTAETLRPDSLTVPLRLDSSTVDVDLDGWTTRGTYVVDGLNLLKQTPNATVAHHSPFLV